MSTIVPFAEIDPAALDALLDDAFGADRQRRTAYRIRAGARALASLSFALADSNSGDLIGCALAWPVALKHPGGDETPLVMVGPIAVASTHQGRGIGRNLMDMLINRADRGADGALMMIGDPEYYGRFWDFSADATADWAVPGPVERHRLLARAANGHVPPSRIGELGPRTSKPVGSPLQSQASL